jgi:hypothetical protein
MSTSTIRIREEAPGPELENLSIEEQIRRRAHEIWLENGSPAGTELIDWNQAEKEILSE